MMPNTSLIFNVLNGDSLIGRFTDAGIPGEIVVMRECLIDGNLKGDNLADFWENRSAYIFGTYHADHQMYFKDVVSELNPLLNPSDGSEFNLWFGYDLFCRTNMWFIMHLLQSSSVTKKVYMVYPSFLSAEDKWQDFGTATPEDLRIAFDNRILCSSADLKLGTDLWTAYKNEDLEQLKALASAHTDAFPYLLEVCQAHIDRFPSGGPERPKRVLQEIIADVGADFYPVFKEFSKREGIYGFGDAQVKRIYDDLVG